MADPRVAIVGGGLAGLAAAMPPCAEPVESATQRARFATLVTGLPLLQWDDTPYQHVAIGGGDARVLYATGLYVGSFPDPAEDESFAHRLMLLTPQPARVLAFGGLETGALRFCLQHPVQQLDLVHLDRRAFELVHGHLDPVDRAVLADSRVRIKFDDPRRYLSRSEDRYDLVLMLQPDPASLLLARNTTVELNRLVAARLAPRGVYVTRFTTGANVQAGETGALGASLYSSLREVFPVVHAAPGPDGLLVAGYASDAVTLDPQVLTSRCRRRGIASDVFVPELLPLLFPPERVATLELELAQAAASAAPTTDNRPVSFIHALTVRQQIANSGWTPLLEWASRNPVLLGLVALLPSLLLLLWQLLVRPQRALAAAVVHATAVTGACGMAWSLLLFFSLQTRVGLLYSQLGALTALFMLGLAVGGAWSTRSGASLPRAQALAVAAAALVAFAFCAFGWFAAWPAALAVAHAVLLAVAGAAAGMLFPAAASALLERGAQARVAAGLVEFADHAGAAGAALFAAVLLIPVLGLAQAAAVLVGLQLLALVVTAVALRRGARATHSSRTHLV